MAAPVAPYLTPPCRGVASSLQGGGSFSCDVLGKAFITFGATHTSDIGHAELLCHVDCVVGMVDTIRQGAPPGIWVASTEMLITVEPVLQRRAVESARCPPTWRCVAHSCSASR